MNINRSKAIPMERSIKNSPQDALSVVYQVDCSPITDENGSPVALFQHPHVKMDVSTDNTLLIGFQTSLYIASVHTQQPSREPLARLRLLTCMNETTFEDDEMITDVKWIDYNAKDVKQKKICADLFAVSYSTGVLRIFNIKGNLHFEQKFHHVAIIKLDVSASVSSTVKKKTIERVDVDDVVDNREKCNGGEIWALYEDSTVAIIQVQELMLRIRTGSQRVIAQVSKFRKIVLRDQNQSVAVFPCGSARPTIFQSHTRLGVHTVVSAGGIDGYGETGYPFLLFYHAGNDQNSIIHLAHIATAMASRAAGAVWSFAKSWGWSSRDEASKADPDDSPAIGPSELGIDSAADHVATPLASVRIISEDQRRRCRGLVLSPTGRLAAISDTLGRIMLIDTYRMTIIRLWKGYRYAQCGWMHGTEGKRRAKGLYLVIYSAQRGIVEVWRARYGPRVFSFAVGDNARLFTRFDTEQQRIRCMVLTVRSSSCVADSNSNEGLMDLIELLPNSPSTPVLTKYFTQNKLQEENFLLHQIIGALHAFAKKRGDADVSSGHHPILEQDAVSPLLDDIANLTSPTSIQALLDVLLEPEMTVLSASFVMKSVEALQRALRNSMASHLATGPELSLLWRLVWLQRILSGFIGVDAEYSRAQHVLTKAIKDPSSIISNHVTSDFDGLNAQARLMPWLELYRRAGFQWSDDTVTREASERAATLNWREFMEFFSMPFADDELPRRRDVLALYEQSEKTEDFIRGAFRLLRVPILRTTMHTSQLAALLTFLFTPVLSNVFAVKELKGLHEMLFLIDSSTTEEPKSIPSILPKDDSFHTQLFLEWYFALPIRVVLSIPPPSHSSAFQRWLQLYVGTWNYEKDMEQDEQDEDDATEMNGHSSSHNKRRLASCSTPLAQIFRSCARSQLLLHAFILAEHCRWSEQQISRSIEEQTLGKCSSVDGGLRWSILQDCIAQAVHLSLLLGRCGKISVETVENVDDIIRCVALMQLNEGFDVENGDLVAQISSPCSKAQQTGDSDAIDAWVPPLENCRNGAQMRSWSNVLHCYPQFANIDSLLCFRASLLCAAWNAERSDMHQLEDAVSELDSISSAALKLAMGIHIWERYIRVHVVTLISFWEESAAGRKPQRGLQPQIARRFFNIIQHLIRTLLVAMAQAEEQRIDSTCEKDEISYDELSENEEVLEESLATFTIECLTDRRRWPCFVRDLRTAFNHKWPPVHSSSSLIRSLEGFEISRVSRARIQDHLSLVLLLDSFAATSVTPVSISRLFSSRGRDLCRPDTFILGMAAPMELGLQERKNLVEERKQFLRQLVRHDEALGIALAESFELPIELMRKEHVLFLYRSGQDEVADYTLDKIARYPDQFVFELASIARARLSLILRRMKSEPEYAMLMGVLPADLYMWIVSDTMPPLVSDTQVVELDQTPSLTATSALLLRCQASLSTTTGSEFEKISAMSVLVKDVIARVKQQQKAH